MNKFYIIESNLLFILQEISAQPDVGAQFPTDQLSYADFLNQMHEYIEEAGEYGIAYESIVATLADYPFLLSGSAAVKLLEVGLLMKFKTELPEDSEFDNR